MQYESKRNASCYFPPILGNGEIAFAPDHEGTLNYSAAQYKVKGISAFDGIVVRCGRRTNKNRRINARLFSLGSFSFNEGTAVNEWSQELVPEAGCVKSTCFYADGAQIHSTCFIHPGCNLYALNKVFNHMGARRKLSYEFTLEGYNDATKDLAHVLYVRKEQEQVCIGFKLYGMDVYTGEVRLYIDKACDMIPTENGVRMEFEVSNKDSVTFFYYVEDNLDGTDYKSVLENIKSKIDASGYEGLLGECRKSYEDYFKLGYVETSDQLLNAIYKTSLYGLKCYTTKCSIPVGLNNSHWDGRYFAFDEYFSYHGLLGANRTELAKRVPVFRRDVCLPTAIRLASDCHKTADSEEMAKYLWETGEYGDNELAPVGTWLDHVFHIPLVGIGAFEYYQYTNDIEFLRDSYRMIRACAKFFTKHMLYQDQDRIYLGKCTDLERLGASVENPFMSSCGAIKLLECCAEASRILGTDEQYRRECELAAKKLRESLPVDNGMYVPFFGCKQKSIAVFAGKFPFDVVDEQDHKLLSAWDDFERNGSEYGNMYPMGKHISPWYACWKAAGYARAKIPEQAFAALSESFKSVGVFCEMFEINEAKVHLRPWFMTACGIFVSAVNEMLLQSNGKCIDILPAFPAENTNLSFKLAVKGGAVAEVCVENGKLASVCITADGKDVTHCYDVRFAGEPIGSDQK